MATFTLEEVQKHAQPDDVCIVFHNKGWLFLHSSLVLS